MRATDLQFRSPKEYTPFGYDIKVTKTGSELQVKKRPVSARGTFSNESRFSLFRVLEKRMPAAVGPGSYNCGNSNIENSVKEMGTLTYKKLHQHKLDGNDGAMLVGSLILYEERFSSRKSRLSDASPTPLSSSRMLEKSSFSRLPNQTQNVMSTATLPALKDRSPLRRTLKAKASKNSIDLRRLLSTGYDSKRKRPSRSLKAAK